MVDACALRRFDGHHAFEPGGWERVVDVVKEQIEQVEKLGPGEWRVTQGWYVEDNALFGRHVVDGGIIIQGKNQRIEVEWRSLALGCRGLCTPRRNTLLYLDATPQVSVFPGRNS